MSDFIIATSSTADLPRTWLEANGVPFIAYSYIQGEKVFEDDCREESRQELYESMRRGDRFKTSMINGEKYCAFFRGILEKGKDLIFLDMSREMSVSYNNSVHAAETVRKEYPDRKLYLMDTRCISGGLGLLVSEMLKRQREGLSFDEVAAWGEENKLKIAHRFTVDDLHYLKEGGRVSNAAALVGSLLSIKPVLYVPDEGTLNVVKKARGRKGALKEITGSILEDLRESGAEGKDVFILHADCREDAESVRDAIRAEFPGIGEIRISNLGVVIGAHCGPGLLAVFYLCGGRRP